MIRVLIGYDYRESVTYHVLSQSIINLTSEPVSIVPLDTSGWFDGQRDGTNRFIYSRFLTPYLMNYDGWAIYMDSDMLLMSDLVELWKMRDNDKAVMVCKHDYKTKNPVKLVGTPMEAKNENYERKNWSSMVLWNCSHPANRLLTKEYVSEAPGSLLHRFRWLSDDLIGSIPLEWNWLVGEYEPVEAKLLHFTIGAPCFSHYRKCDYALAWHTVCGQVVHTSELWHSSQITQR